MTECACGCGLTVTPGKFFIKSHCFKKEKHQRWKGGRRIRQGWIYVRCEGHPMADRNGSYVAEHRLVMEKHLGRYLTNDEHIHHINENKQDNRIENLRLVTRDEHMKIHNPGQYRLISGPRICFICGSENTGYVIKDGQKYQKWAKLDKDGKLFICSPCDCAVRRI